MLGHLGQRTPPFLRSVAKKMPAALSLLTPRYTEPCFAAQSPGFKSNMIPDLQGKTALSDGLSLEGHLGLEPRTPGLKGLCSNQLS